VVTGNSWRSPIISKGSKSSGYLADKSLVYNLVLSMVRSRNSRLSEDTVQKVVTDFLDVLFDLSKPYREFDSQCRCYRSVEAPEE